MANFMLNFSLLLNRVALGMYFLLAGADKTFNVGIQKWYADEFVPKQPDWLPEWFGSIYGRGLPLLELIFGLMFIIGLFGRLSAFALVCMLTSFVIAVMTKVANDPDFTGPAGPFDPNIILATLALMIVFVGPGCFSVDALLFRRKKQADSKKDEPLPKKRDDIPPRRVI